MDWAAQVKELITLFVAIDPIGSVAVFLFVVQGVPRALHRRVAVRAVIIAALMLLVFLVSGQILLEAIGLSFGSFKILGGAFLFLFATTMIFGMPKPASEIEEVERDRLAVVIFPLAVPSIASPGAIIAVVILAGDHADSIAEQTITAVLLLIVLLITFFLLLVASTVQRLIGNTGASFISRCMGVVLATIAVDSIMGGLESFGVLDVAPASVANTLTQVETE